MFKMIGIVALATVSLASLELCSAASAQGIYLGPNGVGVDTGVRVDDGDGNRRDYRRDGEFRRSRDHEHGGGYDRHRFRDHGRYDGGYDRHRRHRDDYQQDGEQ